MADTKAIANRIKSVKDTRKITNAMYLISSTKLSKARKQLESTYPFFNALRGEIGKIVKFTDVEGSRYFLKDKEPDEVGAAYGMLVITADKGLAGSYNQNVIKEALRLMEIHPNFRIFVVGEYGRHYFTSHNIPIDEEFDFPDHEPTLYTARMISSYLTHLYDQNIISMIRVVYTDFINAFSSEAVTYRLLPFDKKHFESDGIDERDTENFDYFPSPLDVVNKCIPVYTIGFIYSALVYSFCCEQNSRMMAMDSANQNADKLVSELGIRYNHLRQNSITQEITEISASVKAAQNNKKR
ncbi:MAG: ATP synthase F1 subunit gamma [Parasporobacterium sp.]|nr:ATP synthase F1 subunit gamma [Parasporobacterium sp.]